MHVIFMLPCAFCFSSALDDEVHVNLLTFAMLKYFRVKQKEFRSKVFIPKLHAELADNSPRNATKAEAEGSGRSGAPRTLVAAQHPVGRKNLVLTRLMILNNSKHGFILFSDNSGEMDSRNHTSSC